MKTIKFLSLAVLLLSGSLVFKSCVSDDGKGAEQQTEGETVVQEIKNNNLNISVFLDLSDRISPRKNPMPGMEISKRDLGYIKSISSAFEDHLKRSKVRQANDNMQVFFEPEPMNSSINTLANGMKLSFDKKNITKEALTKITPIYVGNSSQIYNLALKDQQFVGSDIWTFFKNKVKDYCVKPKHRNILVILTDGYMYHQDNHIKEGNQSTYLTPELISASKLNVSGYLKMIEERKFGFIPATSNLVDLEVLVIGINPVKGKNFEDDVIKKYWEDWLKAMGVKKFYLKGADLPSNLDPVIKKIISNG